MKIDRPDCKICMHSEVCGSKKKLHDICSGIESCYKGSERFVLQIECKNYKEGEVVS